MSNPYEDGRYPEPMPPIRDDQAGEIPRPRAIDIAFQTSVAGALIGAVTVAIAYLVDRDRLGALTRDALDRSGQPATDQDVASAIGMFQVALVLGVAMFLGLMLLVAVKMRAGRNWARLVITALATIDAFSFLNAMAASGADLELIWSLAQVAFMVTAVVYLFRPESQRYFAEHKRRRLAGRAS